MSATIRELANRRGVSKAAITKEMNSIPNFRIKHTVKIHNHLSIDDNGVRLLMSKSRSKRPFSTDRYAKGYHPRNDSISHLLDKRTEDLTLLKQHIKDCEQQLLSKNNQTEDQRQEIGNLQHDLQEALSNNNQDKKIMHSLFRNNNRLSDQLIVNNKQLQANNRQNQKIISSVNKHLKSIPGKAISHHKQNRKNGFLHRLFS